MGHEIFEVVAVGEDVEGMGIGNKYVAYPWMGCGDCDLCNDDMTHYCANNSNLGIHVAGGYGIMYLFQIPNIYLMLEIPRIVWQ